MVLKGLSSTIGVLAPTTSRSGRSVPVGQPRAVISRRRRQVISPMMAITPTRAHVRGFVHRDLNPRTCSSVGRSHRSGPRWLDFGSRGEGTTTHARPARWSGPRATSPSQARTGCQIDARRGRVRARLRVVRVLDRVPSVLRDDRRHPGQGLVRSPPAGEHLLAPRCPMGSGRAGRADAFEGGPPSGRARRRPGGGAGRLEPVRTRGHPSRGPWWPSDVFGGERRLVAHL